MGKATRVVTARNAKKVSVKQQNQRRSGGKGGPKPKVNSNSGKGSTDNRSDILPKKKFPTKIVKKDNNDKKKSKQQQQQQKAKIEEQEDLNTYDDEADEDFNLNFLLNIDPDKLEHVPTRRQINAEKRKQAEEEKKQLEQQEKMEQEEAADEDTLEYAYEQQYFEEKEKEDQEKREQELEKKQKQESSKFKRKRAALEQKKQSDEDDESTENNMTPSGDNNEIDQRKPKKQRRNKKMDSESNSKEISEGKMRELERAILSDEHLKKQRFRERQEIIATIATDVLADPVINIKRLEDLYSLCSDADDNVKKIAILSLAALFKDLIPAYRINTELLSESQGTRLSKEVKELHHFEVGIVKSYQLFLRLATDHCKKYGSKLQIACVKALCELLVAHPHFNYTQLIIDALVPLMNCNYSRRNDSAIHRRKEKVSVIVFEHICKLFANDSTQGEVSLDVIEVIANFIMKKRYRVSTRMVDCFLSLPLKTVLTDKSLPTKIQNKNKKKKKGKKAKDLSSDEAVSRDFAESSGAVSQSHIKQVQADSLRNIIVVYVRALKNTTFQLAEDAEDGVTQKMNEPNIVFCALAGLAKFAHLMNIDLLYDLLDYIRTILTTTSDDVMEVGASTIDNQKLEIRIDVVLQSLITAAKLMEGLGAAIDIDPRDFYAQLYAAIPRVFHTLMDSSDIDHQEIDEYHDKLVRLYVDAVHRLLIVPNLTHSGKLPMGRVCAFVKRICGYCTAFASPQFVHVAVVSMKLCVELMRKYPQMIQMIETSGDEEGSIGGLGGVFDALIDDPDSANANGSVLWDIYNLGMTYHYHPQCRQQVRSFVTLGQKNTERELKSFDYQEMINTFNPYTMENGKNNGVRFVPPVRAPETPAVEKKHEKLQARLNSDKVTSKLKQKLPEAIYVTPSIYASTKASEFFRRGFDLLKNNKLSIVDVLSSQK